MTGKTTEALQGRLKVAAFDADSLPVEESIGHLSAGRPKNSLKGLPGNVHLLGTLLLFQPFPVFETYCFGFLYLETNLFKEPQGNARRLEICYLWYEGDAAPFWRPTHRHNTFSTGYIWAYAHIYNSTSPGNCQDLSITLLVHGTRTFVLAASRASDDKLHVGPKKRHIPRWGTEMRAAQESFTVIHVPPREEGLEAIKTRDRYGLCNSS